MQAATLEREQLRPVYAAEHRPSALPMGEPAPRTSPKKPRRTKRAALLWAAFGFFAGAIFWHAVGFGTFVSEVVHNGNGGAAFAREVASPLDASAHPELPIIYLIDPASCTALELDRKANRTAGRPCPRGGLALRLETGGGREGLAVLTP